MSISNICLRCGSTLCGCFLKSPSPSYEEHELKLWLVHALTVDGKTYTEKEIRDLVSKSSSGVVSVECDGKFYDKEAIRYLITSIEIMKDILRSK